LQTKLEDMKRLLEVCTGSLQSVMAAVEGGAERIELCSALSLDGLTPSLGLLKTIRSMYPTLKIQVLIRPREGDFVYSEEEVRIMEEDIKASLPYADGIVIGALDAEGNIDIEQPKAEQGVSLLKALQKQAGERLIIMPGGGVNTENARLIIDQTGCREIHGSCSAGSGITSAEAVSIVKATICE